MYKQSTLVECLLLAGMLIAGRNAWAIPETPAAHFSLADAGTKDAPASEVTGESWLSHLNRPFGDTSMGKTGKVGPSPSEGGEETQRLDPAPAVGCPTQTTILHGADLYRLNCQGCHGETGMGAPPEINSVIGPVRAASVPLVLERMNKIGASMSRAQATQLAEQAQAALLDRLHNGGKDMPAFPQLSEAEIRSILGYLRQLAGVPGAAAEQIGVSEAPTRVGELIVKSTCHVCHSAAGPDPSPQQLWDGAIPPLESLTHRKDQSGLIEKVTQGAPVIMGTPAMPTRGRMPVFYYLHPDEAADVYLYLTLYPPSQLSILNTAPARVESAPASESAVVGGRRLSPRVGSVTSLSASQPLRRAGATHLVGLLAALALLVPLLVVAGLGFTVWEFRNISLKTGVAAMSLGGIEPSRRAFTGKLLVRQTSCRTIFRRDKDRRPQPSFTGATKRFSKREQ